jgi:AcrR family transcriptional regulator
MTNKKRGRRPRAAAERTRERILRSAVRRFARSGYRGVSMRELAREARVRMFTIQHHFGSKLGLYRDVLATWNGRVEELVRRVLDETDGAPEQLVERVVDDLFDLYLENRDCVAIHARSLLGDGLPSRRRPREAAWVEFMRSAMRERGLGVRGLDLRLLLVTVDGVLNNHALSTELHRRLFGRDVTDPDLGRATKAHLRRVILAILGHPTEPNAKSSGGTE